MIKTILEDSWLHGAAHYLRPLWRLSLVDVLPYISSSVISDVLARRSVSVIDIEFKANAILDRRGFLFFVML